MEPVLTSQVKQSLKEWGSFIRYNCEWNEREFKVEANVGAPQVAYRETILGSSEVTYIHKKQSGGSGQFAKVTLSVEPLEPGKGEKLIIKLKAEQYLKNLFLELKREF